MKNTRLYCSLSFFSFDSCLFFGGNNKWLFRAPIYIRWWQEKINNLNHFSILILLILLLLLLSFRAYVRCVCVSVQVKWKLQKLISTWNDWNKKERRLWTSLFELHGFGYCEWVCALEKIAGRAPSTLSRSALMDNRCGSFIFHTLRTYVHCVHAERWRGYWRSSN